MLSPWNVQKCKEKCVQKGQQPAWDGGPNVTWQDPADNPSANFDVAGCLAECDYPY